MTLRQQLAAAAAIITFALPMAAMANDDEQTTADKQTLTDTGRYLKGYQGKLLNVKPHYEEEETVTTETITTTAAPAQNKAYVSMKTGEGKCGPIYKNVPVKGLETHTPAKTEKVTSVKTRKFNPGGRVISSIEHKETGVFTSGLVSILNPTVEDEIADRRKKVVAVQKMPSAFEDVTHSIGNVASAKLGVNLDYIHGYEGDQTSTTNNNAAAGGTGGTGGAGGTGTGGSSSSTAKTAPVTATGGSSSSVAKTAPVTATSASDSSNKGVTSSVDNSGVNATANNAGVKVSNDSALNAVQNASADNKGVTASADNKGVTNTANNAGVKVEQTALQNQDADLNAVQKQENNQDATNIGGKTTNILKDGDTTVGVKTGSTNVDVGTKVEVEAPSRPTGNHGGCNAGESCDY